jgi:hypothetical protein
VALHELRLATIHGANVPQPRRFLVRWGVALFTLLGHGELADIAHAFDLGAVHRIEPIAAGTINSNFAVDSARGAWFVRVNEGKAEADVAWEARLVEALAAAARSHAGLGATPDDAVVFAIRFKRED